MLNLDQDYIDITQFNLKFKMRLSFMAMNQIIWLSESIHTHKYTSFNSSILITFLLCTNSFVLPVMAIHTLFT